MPCKNCGNVCKDELCHTCKNLKNEMDFYFKISQECFAGIEEQYKQINFLRNKYNEFLTLWSDKVNEYCDRSKS